MALIGIIISQHYEVWPARHVLDYRERVNPVRDVLGDKMRTY